MHLPGKAVRALQAALRGEDGDGSSGQWTRFLFNQVRAVSRQCSRSACVALFGMQRRTHSMLVSFCGDVCMGTHTTLHKCGGMPDICMYFCESLCEVSGFGWGRESVCKPSRLACS